MWRCMLLSLTLVSCGGTEPCYLPAGHYHSGLRLLETTCPRKPAWPGAEFDIAQESVKCGPQSDGVSVVDSAGCARKGTMTGEVTAGGWRNVELSADILCPGQPECSARFEVLYSLQ